ncbi:adhesion G protein-coupled receptor B3-like [Ptychodera flava]|uniref:adhesion G protein-coupled receptor B3-like n=1 Tax=Ptychodera flava TaxID=63121 RepID=UPI00396A6AE2
MVILQVPTQLSCAVVQMTLSTAVEVSRSKCKWDSQEADVEYLFAHGTKRDTKCRDGYRPKVTKQTKTAAVCDDGKWKPDVRHLCEDIDECEWGEHDCEKVKHEICVNTPGNYTCTCDTNYVKFQDGCVPQNSEDEALGCETGTQGHATCDDPTKVLGVTWPETKGGCSTEWIPCSGSAYGFMRRQCDGTGEWLAPDTSECKSAALMDVLANVSSISTTSEANDQLDAVNRYLGNEENEDYGGDLLATVDVLREVTKTQPLALQGPPSTKQKYVQGFLGAIDKAVDDKNEDKWQNANKLLGPEKSILAVFELIDQFSKSLYNTVIDFQGTVDQTTNKIQLRAEILSSKHVLKRSLDEDKGKCNGTCVIIPSYLRATNSTEPLVMVTVVYNDPADIIPSKFVQSESNSRSWVKTITAIKKVTKVNTAVISVNIYINNNSQLTHVEEPVLIEFTPIQLGYDAQCSYMKYGDATGVWSTEGCLTDHVQGSDKITCKCNHLTTFAVIMTLGKKPIPFPEEARDIVMHIACYLSVTLMLLSFCMVCTAGLQIDGYFVLVNIISSLTLHPISIIWNLVSDGDESPCKTVKFLWYFALLSNFAWVMNYSIHQFLKLRKFIIRKNVIQNRLYHHRMGDPICHGFRLVQCRNHLWSRLELHR